MVHINIINIISNYKRILYNKIAYTNYFTNSLNIYASKTPIPNFSTLFTHPFINKKLYYNSGLFLNKSINLISIGL